MPLDYVSVKKQIAQQASQAPAELSRRAELLAHAREQLSASAKDQDVLRAKVAQAASHFDRISCAIPTAEDLTASHPLPPMPKNGTLIAIDGSQIQPNPHEAVGYYLLNLGIFQMQIGSPSAPKISSQSVLALAAAGHSGIPNEAGVSLERDSWERVELAKLAAEAQHSPVITLTDGVLELWEGNTRSAEDFRRYEEKLAEYLRALSELERIGAATAGYVDKPRAGHVVRLLEIAQAAPEEMEDIRNFRPLLGIPDTSLFTDLIGPGERSSIFQIQFHLMDRYAAGLALHFFYINAGTEAFPWIARVEIPAWVAQNPALLNDLHAILYSQCSQLENIRFPYALHRSHEIAVVQREDREQVQQMVSAALRDQGLDPEQISFKQSYKNFSGRRRL